MVYGVLLTRSKATRRKGGGASESEGGGGRLGWNNQQAANMKREAGAHPSSTSIGTTTVLVPVLARSTEARFLFPL